jgi:Leucine-rich repeat (LRR) protein
MDPQNRINRYSPANAVLKSYVRNWYHFYSRGDQLRTLQYWSKVAQGNKTVAYWLLALSWPRTIWDVNHNASCRNMCGWERLWSHFRGTALIRAYADDIITDLNLACFPPMCSGLTLDGNGRVSTHACCQRLSQIRSLTLCRSDAIPHKAFAYLENLEYLDASISDRVDLQPVNDECFRHLPHLTALKIYNNRRLTDAAFTHLTSLRRLNMKLCVQGSLTDASFASFSQLTYLDMSMCVQPVITDNALSHLSNVCISYCAIARCLGTFLP